MRVAVVHELPGRVRLEIKEIRRRPQAAAHLTEVLPAQNGVREAEVNFVTGRVLVFYAPDLTSADRIQENVAEILASPPRPKASQEAPQKKTYELERMPLGSQLGLTAATGFLLLLTYLRRDPPDPQPKSRYLSKSSTILTILMGIPIFRTALDHLLQKKLSTELLAGGAAVTSLFLNEDRFGLSVLGLVYLNTLIRSAALEAVRDKIRGLLEGKKPVARLVTPEGLIVVPGEQLVRGSLVKMRSGERFPCDGRVEAGGGAANQFPVQGKPGPRRIVQGDLVLAGSILVDGAVSVRALRVGEETKIGRLIDHLKERDEETDKKDIRKLNQLSLLALALAGLYFLRTKNMRGALNILVLGMPGTAGLARAIPAEIGAVRAAAWGALLKSGKDLAKFGCTDLILVEEGSFLAKSDQNSQEAAAYLKNLGYKFLPVTVTAAAAAALPAPSRCSQAGWEKVVSFVKDWQKRGGTVAMAGAGLGDAPALSAVDVGITQAAGADLHLKSASIILTDNDPRSLAKVALLARNSQLIAKENSGISAGSSLAGYTLGFLNRLTPFWTGLIQNLSTLAILANSGRLLLPISSQAHLKKAGLLRTPPAPAEKVFELAQLKEAWSNRQ